MSASQRPASREQRRAARHAGLRRQHESRRQPFALLLDSLKQDINIGGIVRLAHSALAREIIIVGTREWNRYAARSADQWENIVELPDPADALRHIRECGWRLVAVEQREDAVPLWDATYPDDAVFAFGHEVEGLSRPFLEAADLVVQIPQWGLVGSLNVAHSAAIVVYDWVRRHIDGYPPPHVPLERTKRPANVPRPAGVPPDV